MLKTTQNKLQNSTTYIAKALMMMQNKDNAKIRLINYSNCTKKYLTRADRRIDESLRKGSKN